MIFDPNYPIELHTGASSGGYETILMHKIEGKNRIVGLVLRNPGIIRMN